MPPSVHLRLPATSANLGPGFDALGLALDLALQVDASEASEFHIEATGRNAVQVCALDGNLLLETYRSLVPKAPPLALKVHNEIPFGMGLGSSAAALLAGVMLANHFGRLRMTEQQVLEEACRREGHPDNVAACMFGGLTASAMDAQGRVTFATFPCLQLPWRLLLALPEASVATKTARALLPATYTRADAVANIQATALLLSAFALNRPDLLDAGTRDCLHQPYRGEVCPLLPLLLPLASQPGIYSVSLSGAGPSVMLVADAAASLEGLLKVIREGARDDSLEVLVTRIGVATSMT